MEVPDGKYCIDAYAVRNIAAFINFSCDPNLEKKGIKCPVRKLRVAFFTKRNLKPGEELGYLRDEGDRKGKLKCNCGSGKCKGML